MRTSEGQRRTSRGRTTRRCRCTRGLSLRQQGRYVLSLIALILAASGNLSARPFDSQEAGRIEGGVFDMNGAVIQKVSIIIEDAASHTVTSLKTDDVGRYALSVEPGVYLVSTRPFVGFPIPYEHSSFRVAAGETVMINFRPNFPFAIEDLIEGGHWIERYSQSDGFIATTTHFVHDPKTGAIKDLRVQYVKMTASRDVLDYRTSVTASFDRYTIYADKVIFYPKRRRLVAEQDLLFEDGKNVLRCAKVEIDLVTGSVLIDGKHYSPAAPFKRDGT